MLQLLRPLLAGIDKNPPFAITFPDGTKYTHGDGAPTFTIHFKTENSVRESLANPSLGFGENYMRQEIEIDGDLQDVSRIGLKIVESAKALSLLEKAKFAIAYLSRANTLAGSRRNIANHYDLGNDFYARWLDPEMQYTCAYFRNENDSLEQAQIQKMDHVCRKLRLKPGDTLVEAGCGWGGLGLHAATKYGARVRSYNISKEQIAYARERAAAKGVSRDRLEYVLDDYRSIPAAGRVYDKFVSVGMLEHVGKKNYRQLFDIIAKVTRPKGISLVHSIARIEKSSPDPWLEKYIFHGYYMPTLSQMVSSAERKPPLHVVDVENLRYHYALTVDHWHRRFEQHSDAIRSEYGESFVRMFRLYLRAAAAGFRFAGLVLFQVVLSNGQDDSAPMTREGLYAANASVASARAEEHRVQVPGGSEA